MRKSFLVLSVFLQAFASSAVPPSIDDITSDTLLADHFTKFVQFYGKHYDVQDQEKRFNIFRDNLKLIQELNSSDDGVEYDINSFADLTPEEFKTKVLSSKIRDGPFDDIFKLPTLGKDDILNHLPILHEDGSIKIAKELPQTVDWSKSACTAPIKDQSMCGSCWAFSTINPMETLSCSKSVANGESPTLVELSEQQLVDCDKGFNEGCDGGLYHVAYEFIKKNGICAAKDYSYTGSAFSKCKSCSAVSRVSDVRLIKRSIDDVKAAVARAPLAVAIDASRIQFYRRGVLDSCKKTTEYDLNHAVNLAGYGVDADSQTPFWLIRNSWGGNWGDKGYFRLKMYELKKGDDLGTCGVHWGPVAIDVSPLPKRHIREAVVIG